MYMLYSIQIYHEDYINTINTISSQLLILLAILQTNILLIL